MHKIQIGNVYYCQFRFFAQQPKLKLLRSIIFVGKLHLFISLKTLFLFNTLLNFLYNMSFICLMSESALVEFWENRLVGIGWEFPLLFCYFRMLFNKNMCFSKTYSYRYRHNVIDNYLFKAWPRYLMVISHMYNSRDTYCNKIII